MKDCMPLKGRLFKTVKKIVGIFRNLLLINYKARKTKIFMEASSDSENLILLNHDLFGFKNVLLKNYLTRKA